jgi:hypothetical protein
VSAAVAGNYVNSLAAGALQTSLGNNASPAVATLTVTAVTVNISPTLHKSFSPDYVSEDETSTLTITLSNPNSTAADLTAPLVDELPFGLEIAGRARTTCGGTVTTTDSKVVLTGGSIPADGSCTITVDVISDNVGTYHDKIPAGALQTNKGSNTSPAVATLTVYCRGKGCDQKKWY